MQDEIAKYDDFWAAFFGVEPAQLRNAGVNVVRHAHLRGYAGVWFFVRGACVVVSTPDSLFERLSSRADRIRAEPLPSPQLIVDLLGREPDRVIGPVYQGYLPREAFRPVRNPNVRRLSSSDEPNVLALRSACSSEEWEHSSLSSASDPRFGYFDDGRLLAVAGTDQWTLEAIGPGVLSHPDQRGRGYGTAVVGAVVEHALAAGKLLLYQTLMENEGSIRIAERLGYQQYATHAAIRVQPEAGNR